MSIQLDAEAERMRRVPGIIFVDGISGRRARIAGTGLEVFEVIGAYQTLDEDWSQLQEAFHWLTEAQLRAAVDYYRAYPDEVNADVAENNFWTQERAWETYPATRPPWAR